MAILAPKLVALREEFNRVAPNRDKASDGWIGDPAHAKNFSGHNPDETGNAEFRDSDSLNEVRAIDIDSDLRQPGLTMEECFQYLRRECITGRITWIHYLIYNGRICSRNSGWVIHEYAGANKHDKHMHVSGNTGADSPSTRPVGLASLLPQEDHVAITQADAEKVANEVWSAQWLEYADEDKDGVRDPRRIPDLIFNMHKRQIAMDDRLRVIEETLTELANPAEVPPA